MPRPPHEAHRLIERVVSDPKARATFERDPERLFDDFAIDPAIRDRLKTATIQAMTEIGVHTSMQFKLLAALGRSPIKPFSLDYYLKKL